MTATFESVWSRIVEHAGEAFYQIKGGIFHYRVDGARLVLDRTDQALSRAQLENAHALCPLSDTTKLQDDFRGPSYIFAILMDGRIRGTDW